MNEDKPKTDNVGLDASIVDVLTKILAAISSLSKTEATKSEETISSETTKSEDEKNAADSTPPKKKSEMFGENFKDSDWITLFTKTYKEKPTAEQDSKKKDTSVNKSNATTDNTSTQTNQSNSSTTPSTPAKDPYLTSLEKFKGISGDLGGIFTSLSASAKSVTKNCEQMFGQMDEGTESIVNDSINLVGGLGDAFSGMATMDVGKMISASMQIFQSLWSLFDQKTRDADAIIAASQKEIETAKVEYEKLATTVSSKYSDDSFKQYGLMNVQLEKQKEEIEKQQKAEESKKAKDKTKIAEWEKEQTRITDEVAANKAKAVDAIFGSDLQKAISDFASAYVDAFSKGGDVATAQKDIVKNMIAGIITELIKSDIAEKVKAMRETIAGLLEDGDLSDSDLAEIDTQATIVSNELKDKSDNYKKILDSVGANENKPTLAGQIRGSVATEASVAELAGLFRSQTDSLIQINSKMTSGMVDISTIAKSNILIEINTRQTASNTQTTNIVLNDVKNELAIIRKNTSKDNGIYGR